MVLMQAVQQASEMTHAQVITLVFTVIGIMVAAAVSFGMYLVKRLDRFESSLSGKMFEYMPRNECLRAHQDFGQLLEATISPLQRAVDAIVSSGRVATLENDVVQLRERLARIETKVKVWHGGNDGSASV